MSKIPIPEEVTREMYAELAEQYEKALNEVQERASKAILLENRCNDLERENEEVLRRYEAIELREKNTRMRVIELLEERQLEQIKVIGGKK